jgi:hypothetical protein
MAMATFHRVGTITVGSAIVASPHVAEPVRHQRHPKDLSMTARSTYDPVLHA